jgi:hypothetical protein
MKTLTCLAIAVAFGLGVMTVSAWADGGCKGGKTEKKVTIDQVPAAVKATILKEAGDNKITEIEEETKDGVTVYEAEWKVGGKEVEIKVAADGKLLSKKVEEEDEDDD